MLSLYTAHCLLPCFGEYIAFGAKPEVFMNVGEPPGNGSVPPTIAAAAAGSGGMVECVVTAVDSVDDCDV